MEIQSYKSKKKTLFIFLMICFSGIYLSSQIFESDYLLILQKWSHGLIDPNLVVFGIFNIILIFILLVRVEKIPLKKLGLINLKQGIIVLFFVWLLSQLLTVAINLLLGQPIQIHTLWSKWEITYIIGFFIAMVLGTAFFEEIAFRGYLLPQFFFLIKKRQKIVWAIICSSLLFSIFHIPSLLFIVQLSLPSMLLRLLMLFMVGLISCFAYLRTGNIFVLVAIHALNNAPTPIFQSTLSPSMISVVLSFTLLVFWPFIFGNRKFMEWYPIKIASRNNENAP